MVSKISRRCFQVNNDSIHLPFLYLTRTLFPSYRAPRLIQYHHYSTESSAAASAKNEPSQSSPPSEEFSSSEEYEGLPPDALSLRRLLTVKPAEDEKEHPRRSTITPAERTAFQQMFKSVALDPKSNKEAQSDQQKHARRSRRTVGRHRVDQSSAAQAEISDIFSKTVRNLRNLRKTREAIGEDVAEHNAKPVVEEPISLGQHEVQEKQQQKIEPLQEQSQEQPQEQQQCQTRNLGQSEHQFDKQSTVTATLHRKLQQFRDTGIDPATGTDKAPDFELAPLIADVAERETKKICKAMDDAVEAGKADIGIWKECESRVFPMLKLVSPKDLEHPKVAHSQAEDASSQLPSGKASRRNTGGRRKTTKPGRKSGSSESRRAEAAESTDDGNLPALDVPSNVPILPVLVLAYPETLVYALQLLHKNFPLSPFSTQLHEAVKSHSRLSSVLGGSTEFYNELISFRWNTYKDLPDVISLVKEMEVTGVPFNDESSHLLHWIRRDCHRAKRIADGKVTEDGSAGYSWWRDTEESRMAWKELLGYSKGEAGWSSKMKSGQRGEGMRKNRASAER